LLSIGILVIFSSSPELAGQQFIFAVAGFLFYFLIAKLNYEAFRTLTKPLYFLTLILLLLVFILGFETRGSIRWIPLGIFNIQPSEFAKPVIILLLADFWSRNRPSWLNLFKSFLYLLFPVLLIFKQPDLGTAITILAVALGMLFLARVSYKKVLMLFSVLLLILPLFWFGLHDYQRQRITSFLSPGSDPLGQGYNVIQSTIAVGSGQLLGRGLGHGTQSRLQFLPEFRTDFIFAAISEELGFVGSILILVIYFGLVMYCFKISSEAKDIFGVLMAGGVGINILFQTIVNIGMNIGLLPITGITLPLISYGGSSLLATLISLGFVTSVAKKRRKVDMEAEIG
jgi:rod shape determining protein RodA